jgi:hypothetical protein
MTPVAYVQGYSSSVTSGADAEPDTIIVDVGEHETVAIIQTRMPLDAGDVPLSQYVHGVLLKYLTGDARAQGLVAGNIKLWKDHTEADLVDEITKTTTSHDSVFEHSRSVWRERNT